MIGVVAALLLGGGYAVWSARGDSPRNDAGWLDSLDGVQGSWVSNAGFASDGTKPWTTPVRLTIRDDVLSLYAACNHLGAKVAVEDHRVFANGGVGMTQIGCPEEPAAVDAWLAALIDNHATVALKGSTEGSMLAFDTDAGWIGFIRGDQ
ncbi:hypothetical protein JNB_15558 [Janibacter sp. HTCC2649]|nr:hypothetical protein JNB_15558 [Janibacter sp. HTCC2649]